MLIQKRPLTLSQATSTKTVKKEAQFSAQVTETMPARKSTLTPQEVENLWKKVCLQQHKTPKDFVKAYRQNVGPLYLIDAGSSNIFHKLVGLFYPDEHIVLPFHNTSVMITNSNQKPFNEYVSNIARNIAHLLFSKQQAQKPYLGFKNLNVTISSEPYKQLYNEIFTDLQTNAAYTSLTQREKTYVPRIKEIIANLDRTAVEAIEQCLHFEHQAFEWVTLYGKELGVGHQQQFIDSGLRSLYKELYRLVNISRRQLHP
jgi:hypothetical protein